MSFLSNRSQAVRPPRALAFRAEMRVVAILRDGSRRTMVPSDAS